ncbi:hypothetical protein IWQ60_000969 [Tieghemiomyces parasiticus]|uniref:Uncharacterized protein n=1 Tax=Tieghemiomyces parasiticus TaxID=78921 RepID=A0A9W8AF10_9FUNG|nr:hypothetical protein IWQ60_000969 [Tieghemiomyces parasiticus]
MAPKLFKKVKTQVKQACRSLRRVLAPHRTPRASTAAPDITHLVPDHAVLAPSPFPAVDLVDVTPALPSPTPTFSPPLLQPEALPTPAIPSQCYATFPMPSPTPTFPSAIALDAHTLTMFGVSLTPARVKEPALHIAPEPVTLPLANPMPATPSLTPTPSPTLTAHDLSKFSSSADSVASCASTLGGGAELNGYAPELEEEAPSLALAIPNPPTQAPMTPVTSGATHPAKLVRPAPRASRGTPTTPRYAITTTSSRTRAVATSARRYKHGRPIRA